MGRNGMGRNGYGPKWSWAEMVMGRNDPESVKVHLSKVTTVVDQLPRLGERELICLLLFTCNHVVSVWRGFLFLRVLGMGYVILLWHSLSLPYNYFTNEEMNTKEKK